jgi:hypothetical protein
MGDPLLGSTMDGSDPKYKVIQSQMQQVLQAMMTLKQQTEAEETKL